MDLLCRYVGPHLLLVIIMLSLVQGAVPGAGDALNAFLGYYFILRKAKQAELSERPINCFSFRS